MGPHAEVVTERVLFKEGGGRVNFEKEGLGPNQEITRINDLFLPNLKLCLFVAICYLYHAIGISLLSNLQNF